MFNRMLQVKVVKTRKQATDAVAANEDSFDDKAMTIAVVADTVIKKVAMAALAYVVVDTARQVLVARAMTQS